VRPLRTSPPGAKVENVALEAIAAEVRRIKHPLVPALKAEKVGKQTAHDLVYEASMHGIEHGISFEQALLQNRQVKEALDADTLRAALDPATYVGHAPQIVDRVLAETKASGWLD
jgi:adenylosuccinate lyase